jgi:hypothetical protein
VLIPHTLYGRHECRPYNTTIHRQLSKSRSAPAGADKMK